ncbi:MAG: MlaD family protein [Desulfobacterales bacterium]|nr:MlaD family protein [Desulfobacterales bacterium]
MINRRRNFLVGLFVASGLTIAVAAIIWLGMSRFFEKGSFYAVYFDESVQGLSVDSPVKYRGVAIGRVERIVVAPDSRLIEVILKIESDLEPEEDMVAQLKVVGITGSMFIELDRHVAGEPIRTPKLRFPTEYPVLASRPSDISQLFRGIDDIVQKLNTFDIAGISARLKITLDHIDQAVVATDVKAIGDKARHALTALDQAIVDLDLKGISKGLKQSLASLNRDLDPARWDEIMGGLQGTIVALDKAVGNLNQLLANASGVVDKTGSSISMVNNNLYRVGRDLETAGGQLKQLLEQLNDQPSRLLFSQPPPRRKTEDR